MTYKKARGFRGLPFSTGRLRLALRELEAFAGAFAAVLLRFFFARVAGEEAVAAQRFAQRFVHLEQRAGDAVAHGAGLSGRSAAGAFHVDVEARAGFGDHERLPHDLLQDRAGEVIVDRLFVDRDDALTESHPHARDGAFTTAGAEKKFCWLHALRQRRGLLGRVRMRVADVDAETSELDVAHPVGRQHAANGALDQTFRVLRTNL